MRFAIIALHYMSSAPTAFVFHAKQPKLVSLVVVLISHYVLLASLAFSFPIISAAHALPCVRYVISLTVSNIFLEY